MSDTKRFPKYWTFRGKAYKPDVHRVIKDYVLSRVWRYSRSKSFEACIATQFTDKKSDYTWRRRYLNRGMRSQANQELRNALANDLENFEPRSYKKDWLD